MGFEPMTLRLKVEYSATELLALNNENITAVEGNAPPCSGSKPDVLLLY